MTVEFGGGSNARCQRDCPAVLKAENALRGELRLDCERGWLDVELTLAPVAGARVQYLAVRSGRPPQPALKPALKQAIDDTLDAMAKGAHALRLAPGADRGAIAAVLGAARSAYGSCKASDVLSGDFGTRTAAGTRAQTL